MIHLLSKKDAGEAGHTGPAKRMAQLPETRVPCRDVFLHVHSDGISEPNFYAWRAELARRNRARPSQHRAQRSGPRTRSAVKGTFLPIRVVADPEISAGPAAIDIVLRGGVIVRVRKGFDAATLAQAIAVLENPGC